MPGERRLSTTLGSVERDVAAAGFRPPAIIVVGAVVEVGADIGVGADVVDDVAGGLAGGGAVGTGRVAEVGSER
jgi:uroporphyrin-III C-methyltransferase/precorrin-2 dehydrogenase/sirohydrochlorin ferrochelatase